MKNIALVLILNFGLHVAQSQNFVPNPGFTFYSTCPSNQSQLDKAFPWTNPTLSTPDFWHSCSGHVPYYPLAYYQNDHTNVNGGYAGIYAFAAPPFTVEDREYLHVRLIDSLHFGSHYCVKFFASLTEMSGIAVSDLGIFFSDSTLFVNNMNNIQVIPQIENPVGLFLIDTANWMKISGIYLAHGGEQYITLGNFRDSASSHAVVSNALNNHFAYYLIDDVSVINCDSLFIDVNEINLNVATSIYPNPVKDELTIDFSGYALEDVQVRVLNVMGCEMISAKNKWVNKIKLNITSLATGLYIAEIRSKNGVVDKKFLKER